MAKRGFPLIVSGMAFAFLVLLPFVISSPVHAATFTCALTSGYSVLLDNTNVTGLNVCIEVNPGSLGSMSSTFNFEDWSFNGGQASTSFNKMFDFCSNPASRNSNQTHNCDGFNAPQGWFNEVSFPGGVTANPFTVTWPTGLTDTSDFVVHVSVGPCSGWVSNLTTSSSAGGNCGTLPGAVPEPTTVLLLGAGTGIVGVVRMIGGRLPHIPF